MTGFKIPNCKNRACHHHNYGYNQCCYMTSWANDPRNCKQYQIDVVDPPLNKEVANGQAKEFSFPCPCAAKEADSCGKGCDLYPLAAEL